MSGWISFSYLSYPNLVALRPASCPLNVDDTFSQWTQPFVQQALSKVTYWCYSRGHKCSFYCLVSILFPSFFCWGGGGGLFLLSFLIAAAVLQIVSTLSSSVYHPLLHGCAGYLSSFSPSHVRVSCSFLICLGLLVTIAHFAASCKFFHTLISNDMVPYSLGNLKTVSI